MYFRYLFEKLVWLALSLFCVATITFFLMHAIPGDPFLEEQAVPKEILQNLYKHYDLDKPIFIQYLKYMGNLLCGDLGPSFKFEGRQVSAIIADCFPVSFLLGLEALAVAVSFGVFFGIIGALHRGKPIDHVVSIAAIFLISVPNFILATLLQYCFAIKLNIFPVARWGSFMSSVLPALSLSAVPMAYIARLTRSNAIDICHEDYILTARSKGLSTFSVVMRHVLKNALLPVISYFGPLCASILTGSFIVEKIYGIPGLGNWFVSSISSRDYTVIMGITIFYSFILLLSVFAVDIIYPLLDPRIKLMGKR